MPHIELRSQRGTRSPDDLIVNVQDHTFDDLMSSTSPEIQVSAYLDRDWPKVERKYAELYIHEDCKFESKVRQIIPGSKIRRNIDLPGPMTEGEQLIVVVSRIPLDL